MNKNIIRIILTVVISLIACLPSNAQRPLPKDVKKLYGGQKNTFLSFESKNYPDHFIAHKEFNGLIARANSDSEKSSATFKVVPGLSDPNLISFESVDYPNHFLRHTNFSIKLHKNDGTQLFKEDATFKNVSGLAGTQFCSFESSNYPEHFIRHRNRMLWIDKREDTDLFKDDGSFRQKDPLSTDEKD